MAEKRAWLDSSIIHFAAGCIGYRWAVKVLRYVFENPQSVYTDPLTFTEVLERYERSPEADVGVDIYNQLRRGLKAESVVEITAADFLSSSSLYVGKVNPRLSLRVALMKRLSCADYLSTFATGIEHVAEVQRVNFMERIS